MIDEKKIEEVAEKYAKFDAVGFQLENWGEEYYYQYNVEAAFKAGIKWLLDNLWIDATNKDNKPIPKHIYLLKIHYVDEFGNVNTGYTTSIYSGISGWSKDMFPKNCDVEVWDYADIDDLLKGGK